MKKKATKTTKPRKSKFEKRRINSELSKKDFERYLEEIERPEYDGSDISWALPENTTPLEKAKYKICERILAYQQDNDIPVEEIARRIHLTTAETKDILHYHLSYFTFERLLTYLDRLLYPFQQIEVIIKEKKNPAHAH